MEKFDLQAHLDGVYTRYPEAEYRPIIGITGNYEDLTCKLGKGYYQSVVAAGGVPVVIPPVADADTIVNTLERVDALILSGGGDINPLWVGEQPSPKLHGINQERLTTVRYLCWESVAVFRHWRWLLVERWRRISVMWLA